MPKPPPAHSAICARARDFWRWMMALLAVGGHPLLTKKGGLMDRRWIYLLVLLYVLLGLPVVTSAEPGAGLDVLLSFTTVYVLTWTLIVVWRYGEHITEVVRSAQEPIRTQLEEEDPTVGTVERSRTEDQRSGMDEIPVRVRTVLDEAARELAALRRRPPSDAVSAERPSTESPDRTNPSSDTVPSSAQSAGSRQLRSVRPPLAIEPLIERVVTAMQAPESTDRCLKRLSEGRVRVVVGELIPHDGPKQTVADHRRHFRQQLDPRLASIGWPQAKGGAIYTYQREPASE